MPAINLNHRLVCVCDSTSAPVLRLGCRRASMLLFVRLFVSHFGLTLILRVRGSRCAATGVARGRYRAAVVG
jgi:hypothetical protein